VHGLAGARRGAVESFDVRGDPHGAGHIGGRFLAPVGYYQSLRLIPTIFGGGLGVVADLDLDVDTVSEWLADTRGGGRIVYVPLVNNADGRVLSRDRACSSAAAVLDRNQRHPGNPVWVIANDVYAGSYLSAGLTAQPLRGADIDGSPPGVMGEGTRRAGSRAGTPSTAAGWPC